MQHWTDAHASSTSIFVSGTALFVLAEAEPASPESAAETRVVVEGAADEVVLTPAKGTVVIGGRTIEHAVHVVQIPVTVKVNGMRSIDGLETMLQSARGRPHLGKHGVAVFPGLFVHDIHQALGQTRNSDDGTTTGRRWHVQVVSSSIQTENPVGPAHVEEGIEGDEISLLANTPLKFVLVVWHRGSGLGRRWYESIVLEGRGAPDRCLALIAGLAFNHVGEVLVTTVERGHPESLSSLPHTLARLFASPITYGRIKFVVMSRVAEIHFPVPVKVVVGVLLTKPLQSEVSRAVDTMDALLRGVLERFWERRRVVVEKLRFGPQDSHVPELLGHVLLNDFLVDALVGPDWESLILDVQEEVNVVFTARLQRQLCNHGAEGVELVVVEVVTSPDAQDVGVTADLAVGVFLFETSLVLVVALLHGLAPVDVGVVDCAHLFKHLVGADVFRVETGSKSTSGSVVAITIRAQSAEPFVANIVSDAEFFVSAKERSSVISGDTGIDIDVGNFDFVLVVHVASLDLAMLLRVLIRVVIGVGVQLDGFESRALGESSGFVAGDNSFRDGFVVAVLGHPIFGGSQGTDTVVEALEPVSRFVSISHRHVEVSQQASLTIDSPPNQSRPASLRGARAAEVHGICDGGLQ